jgi:CRISPR-associated protein Csb2
MPNFLCFSVRFLNSDPAFHGKRDGGEPEWPPSPLRFYQALLDAAANRWRNTTFVDYAKPAFEWLQRLEPPVILAPHHQVGIPFRIAVPDNDLDVWAGPISKGNVPKKQPNDLKSMKTVRPTRLLGTKPDDNAIHYLFSLTDGGCAHLDVLVAAAQSITHLGWGLDMVAGNASVISDDDATRLPGERWRPAEQSAADCLRVPKDGTLGDLARKHKAFLNRLSDDGFKPVPPLSANAYRVVGYRRDHDPAPRPFAAFKLLHPETGEMRSYSATDCVRVAGMIRGAAGQVASASGRDSEWVDRFVYGHHQGPETFPRFSYLPLPSIQPHVGVGRIRRIVIAELPGADGREKSWINRLLSGYVAPNEQGHDALLVPLTRDKVLSRYTTLSEEWTTVTPIALPGCDDGKPDKRDRLFAKALQHAGYSLRALTEVEFSRFPFIAGAEDALKYRPCGDHYLSRCSVYHIRLHWRNPFKGPLALGSGRHCGLGVFAALKGG